MSALSFYGWVEGMPLVPSGISVAATNPNTGPNTCSLSPGLCSLTGTSGLISAFQTTLNANNADGWVVSLSTPLTTGLNATGQVTIDNSRAGAHLVKTAGSNGVDDAGCYSTQGFAGDGFIEFFVGDVTSTRYVGLSNVDGGTTLATVQYAIRYDVTDYDVYEGGAQQLSISGLSVGDILRIQRTGTTITYLRNGVVYYTSATPATGTLHADITLTHLSGEVHGLRMYDAASGYQSLTWSRVTNASTATDTFSVDWSNAGDLRAILGFNTQPTSGAYPQTAPQFCDGLWFPNSPLMLDGDPREFPIRSDRRSTESPTGITSTLVGSVKYHHENLKWQAVPANRYREQIAVTTRGSYENWIKTTQLAQNGYVWFQAGSPVQIYDHTNQLVGSDGNQGGGPLFGWNIPDLNRVRATQRQAGFTGVWIVTWPNLVSQG